MPITAPESFGLVMIESMATGTPVIATDFGSIPEIIRDNKTGFVVKVPRNHSKKQDEEIIQGMAERINFLGKLNRKKIREYVVQNFTIDREAENYLSLYNEILSAIAITK